ncbi:MAG: helix-turn-helix domain-containing protein [Roseburia sp.]
MNSIVAPNVKEIIREKCLKQSAVAKKAGYSDQQFSAMMNGRKIIKDTDILRIATALSVDANQLFERGGE